MRQTYIILFFVILGHQLQSQKIDNLVSFRDIESVSYFRFNYENDFFAATDKNYTQGYNLELAHPSLKKNPINHLFFKAKNSDNRYGISIEHIGFTPSDFVSPNIQFGDRPFVSAIMVKSFIISTDTIKAIRISQSFSIGAIGPISFGKEMQVEIHRATGNKIPGGWDNQIKNDVVLNFRIDYEKLLYHYNSIVAINGQATAQLGTLFTNASVGVNASVGLLKSPFLHQTTKNKFQLYLYSQPMVSAIGYDATLQGGLFNSDSPYTIEASKVERFTAQLNYGLILKTNRLYFEYARTAITREFESGDTAKWGGIRIGFSF